MNSQSGSSAADLKRALGLHQGGRLAEAEALYRQAGADAGACDLVVKVSNTIAHLAGALGKRTLLLPFSRGRFWYWHYIDGRGLWHPSVGVFEQPKPDDWAAPISEITSNVLTLSLT